MSTKLILTEVDNSVKKVESAIHATNTRAKTKVMA